MVYTLRDYQQRASDAAVAFFLSLEKYNGLMVLPTGAGKSLIIADIAYRLDSPVLVFCPTKEIVVQNYNKMKSYTDECSMYSASVGQKEISRITFAMIGSAKAKVDEFKAFKYVIVDEAHGVNGEKGMYYDFLNSLKCKVLGLTATPFRLYSDTIFDVSLKRMTSVNSHLVMLTNDENKFFDKIIYKVQIYELLSKGYLSNLTYYDCKPKGWNEDKIFSNSSGADYSAKSVQWMMENTDHVNHVAKICRRLLQCKRKGVLVFVQFVEDAEQLCTMVADSAYVTGETTPKNRDRIINEFREGKIKIVFNVNCLSTGFDYPELDTVVLARPTLSLALHYQQVGRALRPSKGKDAWVIDTVGNTRRFGKIENLRLETAKATGLEEMFGYTFDYDTRTYKWKSLTGSYMN